MAQEGIIYTARNDLCVRTGTLVLQLKISEILSTISTEQTLHEYPNLWFTKWSYSRTCKIRRLLWCFCAVLKWPAFSQNWTQHLWLFTFRYFDTISQGRVSLSCLPKVGAGILVCVCTCECLFLQLLFHPLSKLTHTHSDDDTAWARGYPHEGIITRFGQKTRRGEARLRVRRLGGKTLLLFGSQGLVS